MFSALVVPTVEVAALRKAVGECHVTENENLEVELSTLRERLSGPSRLELEQKISKMRREKIIKRLKVIDVFDDDTIEEIRRLVREDSRRLLIEIEALTNGERVSMLELRNQASVLEDEKWATFYKRRKQDGKTASSVAKRN